jgi:hypothetical protein
VGQVVKGLRQSITKRSLSGAKRKTLEGVANYLYRNRPRMRYDVVSPCSARCAGALRNQRSGVSVYR